MLGCFVVVLRLIVDSFRRSAGVSPCVLGARLPRTRTLIQFCRHSRGRQPPLRWPKRTGLCSAHVRHPFPTGNQLRRASTRPHAAVLARGRGNEQVAHSFKPVMEHHYERPTVYWDGSPLFLSPTVVFYRGWDDRIGQMVLRCRREPTARGVRNDATLQQSVRENAID